LTDQNGLRSTRIANFRYDTTVAIGAQIAVAGLFITIAASGEDSQPSAAAISRARPE
jgi:hypothetical protein